MKNNMNYISLLALIASSTMLGMNYQGSFESLRQEQERARQERQKQEEQIQSATQATGTSSTTSASSGSAPVITFTEIPSETATASESTPATVVFTAPAVEQIENLNKKIKKFEQRIELLQKESPIKSFDITQPFAVGFEWLKNNRAEFISEKAQTLAYETLKQLEPYKAHERALKKLETVIDGQEKQIKEQNTTIEALQKTSDELEALVGDLAEKNPDHPSLDDMLVKLEYETQQLNDHKDNRDAMVKNHAALVQEYKQRDDKLEEEKMLLKKTFNDALETERNASDTLEASRKQKGQTSLQDLIQAKRNLEQSRDMLLRTPSPSPRISRTPSPATIATPTLRRIVTPRLFATEIAKLNYAIQKGNLEQVQKIITNNPSIINTPDEISNGRTPLHIAALYGQIKIMLELLQHGAKIDAGDTHQETPLHLATMQGQTSAIYVLIEALRSQIKQTLQASQEEQLSDEELTMKIERMVQKIVNAKDKYHDTPLYYAIKFNQPAAAIMLIHNGNANVNLSRSGQLTPLDLVLRKIEELEKTSGSEKTIKVWTYLRDLIQERNGMTREELLQQTLTPPITAGTSPSISASPTPLSSTRSISTSASSMLAPISPAAITSQSEAMPISARMLPVATMTMASGDRSGISIIGPSLAHHEPNLDFPLFRITFPRQGDEYKVPAPEFQRSQQQNLEEALEQLTIQDASEYKESAAEKKS
jgi:ankyrin repeat protein